MKNTRKILSLFLSLLMVITSLFALPFEVFASDKKQCMSCEEWTDSYADCCAEDRYCICDNCHDDVVCKYCGKCYIEAMGDGFCDDADGTACIDCLMQEGYHCADCGECYCDDPDALCGNCFRCDACVDGYAICDTCGWCYECQKHCPECGSCDYEDEKCEQGGEHCSECCDCCDGCGECILGKEQAACEFCGLCEDCCESNQCEACGMCVENPDYDEHLCAECGACFETEATQCETCGLCKDCCLAEAISLGCECGEYCHEEIDDTHICDNCGECYGVVEKSYEAEEYDLDICEDCFAEYGDIDSENHVSAAQSTWSMNETQHWKDCKFCDAPEHITSRAAHNYDELGKCKVCGYTKNAAIIINKHPVNKVVDVPDVNVHYDEWQHPVFNVTAKSLRPLSYQWQYSGTKAFTYPHDFRDSEGWSDGVNTNSLIMTLSEDNCYGLYGANDNELFIRCKITDDSGNVVYTNVATLTVKHVFDSDETKYDENGHYIKCRGSGCEEWSKVQKHTYDRWTWNEERTERTATCVVCGYKTTMSAHKHDFDFYAPGPDEYVLTNSATNEWTANVNGKTYTMDMRRHTASCSDPDCDVVMTGLHSWSAWQRTTSTPTSAGVHGGIHRYCTVCGYDTSSDTAPDLLDESGNVVYWQFGWHPVSVVGGKMDNPTGLVKNGETVTLTPDKKENYTFSGWKLSREVLSGGSYNTYTINISKKTDEYYGFPEDLYHLTIPENYFNDAGVWTLTALYTEGCDHANTELVGVTEATCGHFGYTGDTVCADCGHLIERGQELDKLPHQNIQVVRNDIYATDYRGNIQYKRNGDPIYIARAYSEGDCQYGERGYTGDTYCADCGKIIERGKSVMVHHWEIEEVLREPTTTSKGRAVYCCPSCGITKEMQMDYSGPDYSVTPSMRKVVFTHRFGDKPSSVEIAFYRTGRNADEIKKIIAASCNTEQVYDVQIIDDMIIRVTLVPYRLNSAFFGDIDNSIDIKLEFNDGHTEWVTGIVPVNTNVIKDTQKYTVTVHNGKAYTYENGGFNTEDAASVITARAGDMIIVEADYFTNRWMVVSDGSGHVVGALDEDGRWEDDNIFFVMPANDVELIAFVRNPEKTPGDLDADGETTIADYALLKSYISGAEVSADKLAEADMNGDGALDAFDLFEIDKLINSNAQTNFGYTVTDGQAVVTSYLSDNAHMFIPDTLGGYSVVGIDKNAFKSNTVITEAVIGGSVTVIDNYAFMGCSKLKQLTLSDGLERINYGAFLNCTALETVDLPGTVTSIGSNAFKGCTNLTKITIPASVTAIQTTSFSNCPNLTIYGKAGSYAETYANNNSINFTAI